MSRLLVHVEGETEETFVNEILRSHLYTKGYSQVSARIVGNARLRQRRGGIRGWDSVKKDIVRHLRSDGTTYSTTMVDYYALPQSGLGAWPGRAEAGTLPTSLKAITVEEALNVDIQAEMGTAFFPNRFVPFVMIHEFEGLLFSNCSAFSQAIGKPELEPALQRVRDEFESPEDINDSPISAPSKRVQRLIPNYEKPLMGTLAVIEIGLERIRKECPHFDQWLVRLESLIP
jgi:Domain of unknown function (DUF4276)